MAKMGQTMPTRPGGLADGEVRPIEEHPDVQAARERLRQATARRDAVLAEVRRLHEAAAHAVASGQITDRVLDLVRGGSRWAEGLTARRTLRELEPQVEELEYAVAEAAAALESARAQARAALAPILRARVGEYVRRLVPAVRAAMALADELDGALADTANIDPAFTFAEVAPWPLIRGSFVHGFVERAEAFLTPPPPPALSADHVLVTCRRSFATTPGGDLMRDERGRIMIANLGLIGCEGATVRAGETVGMKAECAEVLCANGFAELVA